MKFSIFFLADWKRGWYSVLWKMEENWKNITGGIRMVLNRLLQDCLEDFHNIMRLNMALYDRNCTCVAGEEEKLRNWIYFIHSAIPQQICRHWERDICLR